MSDSFDGTIAAARSSIEPFIIHVRLGDPVFLFLPAETPVIRELFNVPGKRVSMRRMGRQDWAGNPG